MKQERPVRQERPVIPELPVRQERPVIPERPCGRSVLCYSLAVGHAHPAGAVGTAERPCNADAVVYHAVAVDIVCTRDGGGFVTRGGRDVERGVF